jgi:bifunctional oligoribonuclease and PAP phosphatase NrnA
MEARLTDLSRPSKKKKTEILRRIAEEIRVGERFLISSHENPEGDAIGSLLALGLALKSLGKEVILLNQDPIPEILGFLPAAEEIIHQAPEQAQFDITFTLDCGDRTRLGTEFSKIQTPGKIINIDHHVSNRYFGDINLIDPSASSTAEIIFELLRIIPLPMNSAIAENLYAGVLTDTGSFHYSNTTPQTFSVAKSCLMAGVDPWKVAESIYENQPLPRLRLLSLALATLEVHENGQICCIVVTQQMIKDAGASVAHTEDFINFPRSLKGSEVALLFREITPIKYRVSLRSRGKVNVSQIAQAFQGGGHPNAAGCTVDGSLSEVKGKVYQQIRTAL